jgi:hypothetical protein
MLPLSFKTIFFGFLAAAAPIVADIPYPHPRSYFESKADLSEPEAFRIRKHLAQVESDLRANPPEGLSPGQSEARSRRLDDLHAYWLRGEFPYNPDYPDSLVPYFIDARGVACAVGQLVIASGHREFAEEIARTRNHAYIREIEDPRLAAWAMASGLTLEECGRIQPSYGNLANYRYVQEMKVTAPGVIWTLAAPECMCSSLFQSFGYDPGGTWIRTNPTQTGQATICLDPKGRELIGFDGKYGTSGLMWDGVMVSGSGDVGVNDCEWSADGSVVWVAGNSGMRSYRPYGSTLSLALQLPPAESMFVVATSPSSVWSASSRRAFWGKVEGSAAMNTMDTAGRTPFRITGMASPGKDMLWAGINGNLGKNPKIFAPDSGTAPVFSREGLLFRHDAAGAWTVYDRAGSGLPSDTIQALTPADSQSVWIATAAGIFKFTPPNSVSRVRAGFSMPITDLNTDSIGRLYIATWGAGVYMFEHGETQSLGYYTSPESIYLNGREARAGRMPDPNLASDVPVAFRSLLGRKLRHSPGSGLFVLKVPQATNPSEDEWRMRSPRPFLRRAVPHPVITFPLTRPN